MKQIAIVGMSCRLPGADSPQDLWDLVRNGVNAVTEIPSTRWDPNAFYDKNPKQAGAMYTLRGGFLKHIDSFDAHCFGVAPREVVHMDPQQRLMLELAWEVFEDAGVSHQALQGSATGVFFGFGALEYALTQLRHPELIDAYTNTGYFPCIISNRVSYLFDLRGPSISIDTACSSSLVAVHLACESLRKGECDAALAGGVSLMIDPVTTVAFCKLSALSVNGRCKTFDAAADGYVRGEGAGIVLLKRLEDAVQDGDRIYAVILGEAVNQDGKSNGLTAPNRLAQENVLREAYWAAECPPGRAQYIEAHGTGTFLGDPIELNAIGNVMRVGRQADQPLLVGSLKTNIGHLEAAAGIAGLIKLAKCIEHDAIPPHLHFEVPNPHIPFEALQTKVATHLQPWPQHQGPKVAGISAFGFGGTNAHVVLGDTPRPKLNAPLATDPESSSLLLISARDPIALHELQARYVEFLTDDSQCVPFATICNATAHRRTHFEYRKTVVASDRKAAAEALAKLSDAPSTGKKASHVKIAFLFTGQGAQFVGMGQQLYHSQSVFRSTLDYCDQRLQPMLGCSLCDVLFHDPSKTARLHQTAFTQPAMFALQWALVELWKSWGIVPSLILGHSIGEIAGACAAGFMDWASGLDFAAKRGALMQSLGDSGGMSALLDSRANVKAFIEQHRLELSIAASNGPKNTVVSGPNEEIERAMEVAKAMKLPAIHLNVSHAFHSDLMNPILEPLLTEASKIQWKASQTPFIANLTGELIREGAMFAPQYLQAHARSEVRFEESVATLFDFAPTLCIEIGPDNTLSDMARRCMPSDSPPCYPSMQRGKDPGVSMLSTLGFAFESGVNIDVSNVFGSQRPFVSLPRYPFQRTRYWESIPIDSTKATNRQILATDLSSMSSPRMHPLLGSQIDSPITLFQNTIGCDEPKWLDDHQVSGHTVFPGAAYVEMEMIASKTFSNRLSDSTVALSDVRFIRPLILSEEQPSQLQCFVMDGRIAISAKAVQTAVNTSEKQANWHTVSTASLASVQPSDFAQLDEDIKTARSRCTKSLTSHSLYEQLSKKGLQYGPHFRRVQMLWISDEEVWGEILCHELDHHASLHFSPMLLDACFHVVAGLLESRQQLSLSSFIPSGIDWLGLSKPTADRVYCRARNASFGQDLKTFVADLDIFEPDGGCIGRIAGLRFAASQIAVSAPSASEQRRTWESRWAERSEVERPVESGIPETFFYLANDSTPANTLRELLTAHGNRWHSTTVDRYRSLESANYLDEPRKEVSSSTIIIALDLESPQAAVENGWERVVNRCMLLHDWFQTAKNAECLSRVILLTRGANAIEATDAVSIASSCVAGWFRSMRLEAKKWRCDHIDLDPTLPVEVQWQQVADEVLNPTGDFEVALRNTVPKVRVLFPLDDSAEASMDADIAESEMTSLGFRAKGSLDYLNWTVVPRKRPSEDEIEIRVHSAGLNFRDVLNVLGMYPGDAGPLGGECSGVVSAVGTKVSHLQPGDWVTSLASGSFSDYTITHGSLASLKPPHMSFAEASVLPIATLTASIALRHFGKIKAGDRVLIHAAAGGVGLAAVRIALQAGATVFATAGSEEKRSMLRSLGVLHVANSRSPDFADEFDAAARQDGIDIVLNSLSGDFIPRSLALLKSSGHFIEIGKIETWSSDQVAAKFPSVQYSQFDLAELARSDPAWVGAILQKEVATYSDPLDLPRVETYASKHAQHAFRRMSQAKHIGKIAIQRPVHVDHPCLPFFEIHATYIVTGGMGALGRKLVSWMITQGAKHIELAMHRELRPEEQELLDEWNLSGTVVKCHLVDGSDAVAVNALIARLQSLEMPIRGFFHLAGVLRDGLAAEASWIDYREVLDAKGLTAWNFHRSLRSHDLRYFVLYSSIASLLGSPGQSNYAAANAFLDGLASIRHAEGLPALSLQWGPWGGEGMAQKFHDLGKQWGVLELDATQAFVELERLLRSEVTCASVIELDVARFTQTLGTALSESLVRSLRPHDSTTMSLPTTSMLQGWKDRIRAATNATRLQVLCEFLESTTLSVLGMPAGTLLDRRQPLRELGLDSLMAVEMKNLLADVTELSLDATVLFDHPTIEALSRSLADKLTDSHSVDDIAEELAAELASLQMEGERGSR